MANLLTRYIDKCTQFACCKFDFEKTIHFQIYLLSVNQPYFVFYINQSNENWVKYSFFSPDSAEPFRFKLSCLEAELSAPELLTIIMGQTLYGSQILRLQNHHLEIKVADIKILAFPLLQLFKVSITKFQGIHTQFEFFLFNKLDFAVSNSEVAVLLKIEAIQKNLGLISSSFGANLLNEVLGLDNFIQY